MTDLFGRVVLAVTVVAMGAAAARAAFGDVAVVTPAEAIARAVSQRVGRQMSVEVTALETSVQPERALHALPEPGARASVPTRFVLMAGRVRRGVAVATVTVAGPYARAAQTIARGDIVTADGIEVVEGELPALGFKRLPSPDDVIGLVARRDIAAGEALTQAVVQLPPAVRSGEPVVLTVIAGAVRVTAKAVASSSGHAGDVIRVVPEGGRPLKARITGRGSVEVVR